MKEKILVGTKESFQEKQMQVTEHNGKRYLVCKVEDGYYCVEDKCSHADVKLSRGTIEGEEIICPAHGAKFCLKTGEARCMPAVVGIKTFQIVIEGNYIYLLLV